MKIRIKGNSIRFRLTKSEVQRLCQEGFVQENTNLAGTTFSYAVQATAKYDHLFATFEGSSIMLYIPNTLLRDWDVLDQVGFYHTFEQADSSALQLLLEKDFVCMDETVEDQSDNYPNPKML